MTNLVSFPSPRRRSSTALTTSEQIRAVYPLNGRCTLQNATAKTPARPIPASRTQQK